MIGSSECKRREPATGSDALQERWRRRPPLIARGPRRQGLPVRMTGCKGMTENYLGLCPFRPRVKVRTRQSSARSAICHVCSWHCLALSRTLLQVWEDEREKPAVRPGSIAAD